MMYIYTLMLAYAICCISHNTQVSQRNSAQLLDTSHDIAMFVTTGFKNPRYNYTKAYTYLIILHVALRCKFLPSFNAHKYTNHKVYPGSTQLT